MGSKILIKQSLFILIIVGIIGFFIGNLFFTIDEITNNIVYAKISSTGNIISGKINSNFPIYLTIPTIKVGAPIKQSGLTPSGIMDTTKDPDDLAWFKLGPLPGSKGSSVIAGHYGKRKNGKISVFHDLNKLVKGDKVFVQDDNGNIITFVVRESKIYLSKDNTLEVFTSNDNKSHLNLITCHGAWDEIAKTYHQRLVVFTDKE